MLTSFLFLFRFLSHFCFRFLMARRSSRPVSCDCSISCRRGPLPTLNNTVTLIVTSAAWRRFRTASWRWCVATNEGLTRFTVRSVEINIYCFLLIISRGGIKTSKTIIVLLMSKFIRHPLLRLKQNDVLTQSKGWWHALPIYFAPRHYIGTFLGNCYNDSLSPFHSCVYHLLFYV